MKYRVSSALKKTKYKSLFRYKYLNNNLLLIQILIKHNPNKFMYTKMHVLH